MPLPRRIGCVVSYMTAGAEIKRVHRAGGGVPGTELSVSVTGLSR